MKTTQPPAMAPQASRGLGQPNAVAAPGADHTMMQAIVQTEYGSPEVLSLEEVTKPLPQDNEVLVRIQATSVHAGDWHLMRGSPFLIRLMFGGLLKPKIHTIGTDIAGTVEAVGDGVTQFKPGDEVFGDLSEAGFGAWAEYVAVPATALAPKPKNLSFEQAATVPVSALAALQALRDVGQIQPGQRLLINGASGGVGHFATQLAKAFGAEVTAVCSATKAEMVRSLGADHIIDYNQQDCSQTEQPYDLIVDTAAYRPAADFLPALTPGGTYVLIGGSTVRLFQAMLFGTWLTRGSGKSVKCLVSKPNQTDLLTLKDLIEAGKIQPAIDRQYGFDQLPDAIRHIEARQVQGKVAIQVGNRSGAQL